MRVVAGTREQNQSYKGFDLISQPQKRGLSKLYFLYALMFPNGKRYIGIAGDVAERFTTHKWSARRNHKRMRYPVYEAMRKYGDAVYCVTLCAGTRDFIASLEVRAIAKFRTTEREFGYNLSLGGDTSPMSSPEIRKRAARQGKIGAHLRSPENSAKATANSRITAYLPEVNAARALKLKTLIRVTNGAENRCIRKTEAIPAGWWRGQCRQRQIAPTIERTT